MKTKNAKSLNAAERLHLFRVKERLCFTKAQDLFSYDYQSGSITRRVSLVHNAKAGQQPGYVKGGRYLTIQVDGRNYYAHRIAWLLFYGEWPTHQIDHINGDKLDNRITNLRDVTQGVNTQNQRKARRENGLLGASWNSRDKKWVSFIGVGGRRIYLGSFDSDLSAHHAYLEAKRRLHVGCTI